MEVVLSFYWPDFEKPAQRVVTAPISASNHSGLSVSSIATVIADTAAFDAIFSASGAAIRANCYFMIEEADKEFRQQARPASHKECGAAVLLARKKFQITDCDSTPATMACGSCTSQNRPNRGAQPNPVRRPRL